MKQQIASTDDILVIESDIIKLAEALQDKALEIKMLVDANILTDEAEITNERLVELSKSLSLTSAYVTDSKADILYCNEPETIGFNIYDLDPVFSNLKKVLALQQHPLKKELKREKYINILH